MFTEPANQPDFSALDEAITKWWKENQAFEKSVALREGAEEYIFYDGPPFMSGVPHYATLLSSLPKDVVPRYQTMKGKQVKRLWGWDCHGLPIENKVEDQLGLKGREQILTYGLDKYIEQCYNWNRVGIENWRWYIDKIGRWADLDNAYRTLDQDYMESVWWTFAEMWRRGLIYKGKRTSMYSTDSSTPVSEFEVSMDPDNYRDTEDIAVTVKFRLTPESEQQLQEKLGTTLPIFLAAWTTTPWTLPSNFALAVNAEVDYGITEWTTVHGEKQLIITGIQRAPKIFESLEDKTLGDGYRTPDLSEFPLLRGSDLVGLSYLQLYPFLKGSTNDFKVYSSSYVNEDDGTGILHVAPAFGEADFEMGKQWGLSDLSDIDDRGHLTVGPWAGTYLRSANAKITEDLLESGKLLKQEKYVHRLPYYRYKNPLIYRTMDNYFVDVQKLKEQLFASAKQINWVPEHFINRFNYILETAPDWCISRNRFWATTMPIWQSSDGQQIVVSNREELMQYVNAGEDDNKVQKVIISLDDNTDTAKLLAQLEAFIASDSVEIALSGDQASLSALREKYFGETAAEAQVKPVLASEHRAYYLFNGKYLDLHRPYIDAVKFTKDGKEFTRIEDTLDVWMDSGSMPFAQFHYPAVNKEQFEQSFPGDFIAEYTGQIRAWFYVLHVIANAVFDKQAFKNVLVTGVMAGNDGRKMSKSFGNYPDPRETLQKYGGEALRLYLVGSPVMFGNDVDFSEEELKLQVREFLIPLWNIYKYLVSYANLHNWEPKDELAYNQRHVWDDQHPWDHIPFDSIDNELDAWMVLTLQNTIGEVTAAMDGYNLPRAVRSLKQLLDEISKWYIRRSRERFVAGDTRALETLYYTLIEFCKLAAPIAPFVTEEIYQNLVRGMNLDSPESIHHTEFPVVDVNFIEQYKQLAPEMEVVRAIAELGQTLRTGNGLKVRQPLSKLEIKFDALDNAAGLSLTTWMEGLLREELNVKDVLEVPALSTDNSFMTAENTRFGVSVALNKEIDPKLAAEGTVRELIRAIQAERKQLGLQLGEEIKVLYTAEPELAAIVEEYKEQIANAVSATEISAGDAVKEVKVNDFVMRLSVEK